MGYKCIYDNLTQIKKDLMNSINQVQKRARVSRLEEADIEWAIEKIKKNKDGKIELISIVPNAHKYSVKTEGFVTFARIFFLHRKGKIAILPQITRIKTLLRYQDQANRRIFKELPLISSYDRDVLMLYKEFVGAKKEMKLRRYIHFRKIRENIRNVLKQWNFSFPFRYENFQINTSLYHHNYPFVIIEGIEYIDDDEKNITYFILPKPYGSFRFEGWFIFPEAEPEKIFKKVTGEELPKTPEEIAAILTMATM